MSNNPKFTEADTEKLYDEDDKIYQSFWDKNGTLHWGYFTNENQNDFLKASRLLTKKMANKAKLDDKSIVLDVGCGNGEVSLTLAREYGCQIIGIDLSGVRIANATNKLKGETPEIQSKVKFIKFSATKMPFNDESFSHVWSQATIYHIHDKENVLKEIFRVLRKKGVFVFDDLTKPKSDISEDGKKYIYDRLLFDTQFSFNSYSDTLEKIGFEILDSEDISSHLRKSYKLLSGILNNKIKTETNKEKIEKFKKLYKAYTKMVELISQKELGWAFYLCQKD